MQTFSNKDVIRAAINVSTPPRSRSRLEQFLPDRKNALPSQLLVTRAVIMITSVKTVMSLSRANSRQGVLQIFHTLFISNLKEGFLTHSHVLYIMLQWPVPCISFQNLSTQCRLKERLFKACFFQQVEGIKWKGRMSDSDNHVLYIILQWHDNAVPINGTFQNMSLSIGRRYQSRNINQWLCFQLSRWFYIGF